jgi:hypothetical protein
MNLPVRQVGATPPAVSRAGLSGKLAPTRPPCYGPVWYILCLCGIRRWLGWDEDGERMPPSGQMGFPVLGHRRTMSARPKTKVLGTVLTLRHDTSVAKRSPLW